MMETVSATGMCSKDLLCMLSIGMIDVLGVLIILMVFCILFLILNWLWECLIGDYVNATVNKKIREHKEECKKKR